MKRALLVLLAACGGSHVRAPIAVTSTVEIPQVEVTDVVDQGDVTYILEPEKIKILRGGVLTAEVPLPAGSGGGGFMGPHGASIPALDGEGRWVVVVWNGSLWRVMLDGELEKIEDRFGIAPGEVRSISAAGSTLLLALEHAIAISTDGIHLARYAVGGRLAVSRDRIAVATDSSVEVWDLVHGTSRSFAIHGGAPAFLTSRDGSQLVVTTDTAVWLETNGKLNRIDIPTSNVVTAVSGSRLWVLAKQTLYVLAGNVLAKTDAKVDGGRLFGAPNGDVWLSPIVADGDTVTNAGLRRYSLDHANADPRWTSEVAPVFQRVCSHCHLPGGDADVDLSTPATWAAERAEIVRRVLVTHTMPPAGTELSDPDRHALEGWLRATP